MKQLRVLVLCIGLVALVAVGTVRAQESNGFSPETIQAMQAALDKQVTDRDLPGVAVLVDMPGARFAGASGYADLETQTPLQPDDPFQIGSITKTFTAALVLQLAEEGVLTIEDPLADWLPDTAAVLPHGDTITLHHLLQHTSGVYDYTNSSELIAQYFQNPTQPIDPQFVVDYVVEHHRARFAPGEDWAYSNTNYLLLGLVIEAATGQSYVDVLHSRILEPVGLAHTYLNDQEPDIGTVVRGYTKRIAGSEWFDVTGWDMTIAGAAGGLVSTPSDLALFARALFDGTLYANESTLDLMLDLGDVGYGLGIDQNTPLTADFPAWGHNGGTIGYRASLNYLPDYDLVIVWCTNNGDQDPLFGSVLRPVTDTLRGE
ncbi:MAG: beta-lactamase family protein [Anaerolineae bacterium]|nr:beta-lactamase family protein [Anaerolineae bacterium]